MKRVLLYFLLLVSCQFALARSLPAQTSLTNGFDTKRQTQKFAGQVESHFDRLIHYSLDRYGRTRSSAWVSSIDVYTNELAEANSPRHIAGSHLYLDQPMLLAAMELGKRSGCKCYPDAAHGYVRNYLHQGGTVADLRPRQPFFLDVASDQMRRLRVDLTALGSHTPAVEILSKEWPIQTEAWVVEFAQGTIEADSKNRLAWLHQATIATDMLIWLAKRKNASTAEHLLLQLAEAANTQSQLKNPGDGATAAAQLELAAALSRYPKDPNLMLIAQQISSRQLDSPIKSGLVAFGSRIGESYLTLWKSTGDTKYRDSAKRWALLCKSSSREQSNKDAWTAETYGRRIHFLNRAGEQLKQGELRQAAFDLAQEASANLFVEDSSMFRSSPGVDRCDAIDGPGWLMLALLSLGGSDPTDGSVLHF